MWETAQRARRLADDTPHPKSKAALETAPAVASMPAAGSNAVKAPMRRRRADLKWRDIAYVWLLVAVLAMLLVIVSVTGERAPNAAVIAPESAVAAESNPPAGR